MLDQLHDLERRSVVAENVAELDLAPDHAHEDGVEHLAARKHGIRPRAADDRPVVASAVRMVPHSSAHDARRLASDRDVTDHGSDLFPMMSLEVLALLLGLFHVENDAGLIGGAVSLLRVPEGSDALKDEMKARELRRSVLERLGHDAGARYAGRKPVEFRRPGSHRNDAAQSQRTCTRPAIAAIATEVLRYQQLAVRQVDPECAAPDRCIGRFPPMWILTPMPAFGS